MAADEAGTGGSAPGEEAKRLRGSGLNRAIAVSAAVAAAIAAVVWMVISLPQSIVPPYSEGQLAGITDPAKSLELRDSRIKMQNEVRGSLLQLIGGVALASGLVLTYRQLRINRDGQLTDRFTAAIDHLGQDANSSLAMTLGGIYALERIARDSRSDRSAIQDILAAFIRDRSPWPPRPGELDASTPISDLPRLAGRLPAVQAALTVLGRMPRPISRNQRLDLRRTDLRRANLQSADLRLVDLEEAHLERAWLRAANLNEASLWGTDLTDAKLHEVKIFNVQGGEAAIWPADFDPQRGVHTA
ncbi:pentapeptide repeat-containing protein [Dactylosporangium vinaceum]|uniref:Pentapeptide repeat-containing protein n=1 Tax=Dactylosporangium vinaceum TaxID=53362 RepID=A0ABV5M9T0_9ACTN|nr:pentapeptide repeat-containing protein [Dactylosporangium vinaceum]UAB93188.1 pentapeptide repeat-containing protein [Dactylosporangium vinaceum]